MRTQRSIANHVGGDGAGLPIVMLSMCVISGLAMMVGLSSTRRAFVARRLVCRVRAQAIAETGISQAYAQLIEDFSSRTNPAAFPVTDYAGGSYEVTVRALGEDNAIIQSDGVYDDVQQTVIVDVKRYEREIQRGDIAFGYGILADDEISWTGCGLFEGDSRVHANDTFKQAGSGELNAQVSSSLGVSLNGNSGQIDGPVTAPQVTGKTGKITGLVTEMPLEEVPIPAINLVPYYNQALANNEVYNGNITISGDCAPQAGIMWVNGDLQIAGQGVLTGCFIATGNIHYSGSGAHHKVAGYPAFISRDGDIKFSGAATIEGLIYTRLGDVEHVGSGRIDGSIICGGDFKKGGCSTIFAYVDSTPIPPGEPITDGVLCVSAWQK